MPLTSGIFSLCKQNRGIVALGNAFWKNGLTVLRTYRCHHHVNRSISYGFESRQNSKHCQRLRVHPALRSGKSACGSSQVFLKRRSSHWEMAAEKAKLRFLKNREKRAQLDKGPQQSSVVSLQIIGDGSLDSPQSLLIITDMSRYLFNCGEGTQRLLMECGTRNLSKLEHIFFTRMSWENIGGSIGMTITLKNIGLPRVTMYGPQSLEDFKKALQIFAKQEAIDINIKPYTDGPFKNDTMVVTPIPLLPVSSGEAAASGDDVTDDQTSDENESEEGTLPMEEDSGSKRKLSTPLDVISEMAVKSQHTGAKKRKKERLSDFSIAYVCKLHDKPGKLLAKRATELGLKPSLHFERAKAGETITLDDGRTVGPQDVLGPTIPGQVFIVLECPSLEYIEPVITNETFPRHFADCGDETAALVLHMCPEEVLGDTRYQEWISRFGPSTEHVVFNRSCQSLKFDASRGQQTFLNQLHNDIFPVLPSHSLRLSQSLPSINIDGEQQAKLMFAEIYNKYHMKPAKGWERDFIVCEDRQRFLDELASLQDFQTSLKSMRESLEGFKGQGPLTERGKYPEVVFLGTGSAMPNKARNVSGILLNTSETRSLIMDCGEGTFGQLCRYYGDKVDDIISRVQCIFISHIHADHHAGLINLLRHWNKVTGDDAGTNLLLVGPKRMFIWLNEYHNHCESFINRLRFIELGDINVKTPEEERSKHESSLLSRLNLQEFNSVYVRHCPNAHGLTLTHQDGWKVVYSGDTMPSDALIEAGKGADLLIHEATLEDGMNEEAKKKRHSMISEAIQVGQAMEAKFLLLTHFSQRYPKVPLIDSSSTSSRVGIAFDNMRVSFSELEVLPVFLPVLKHLFAEEIQELEVNRDKKAEKKSSLKSMRQHPKS
ncbi:zinc phosphodiesterase ELAC protein 2-like [Diadema antillarum]|uniref:zinc phosphodiesterase ELAC protein 2-like n=1 Tax=Diadema antillarum TaxID=105358 RepID=UPI003A858C4B